MSNNISLPNTAAPGVVLSTVWYVEQIAQAAFVRNSSMSKAVQVSDILRLKVLIMSANTAWTLSRIAFACGLLIVVGLRFSP